MATTNNTPDTSVLDVQIRKYVYDRLLSGMGMPLADGVAMHLGLSTDEVRTSYRRLKEGHILVLQEGDEEILMANPFSAVPTSFLVETATASWWGNCIWDAMGIAAMLKEDARISTGCGDCNDSMVLLVQDGTLTL